MKVLFVSSGNSKFGINPIIKSQGEAIKQKGIYLSYFTIKGKGLIGYIRNVQLLKKCLNQNNYDIIHAHYALCGWISLFSKSKTPVIVSYMGCDVYGDVNKKGKKKLNSYYNIVSAQLLQPFVNKIIVKSKNLEKYVFLKKKVVNKPNGVNFSLFKPYDKEACRSKLQLPHDKKLIFFLGNPSDPRKNLILLQNAVQRIQECHVEIVNPYPVAHADVVTYLNACDVLALPSYLEGSPNVIKEAMACNTPIVATDVGDVRQLIEGTKGCFISSFSAEEMAGKIKKALAFEGKTNGREKIRHLDSRVVAQQIIDLYKQVVDTRQAL